MGRITLPPLADIDDDVAAQIRASAEKLGHIPHNALLFSRIPGLANAMVMVSHAILTPGRVGMELKWLVGHMSSRVAGCRFCWAHTAHLGVNQSGVDPVKFEHIWEFETSEHYDDRERAALRVAASAGVVPNAVTDEQFEELRRFFDDDEILELVAVIAMYGFFNRWNDTLSVPIEDEPLRFGLDHLASSAWSAGPHAPQPRAM